jgi:hypothetical protein
LGGEAGGREGTICPVHGVQLGKFAAALFDARLVCNPNAAAVRSQRQRVIMRCRPSGEAQPPKPRRGWGGAGWLAPHLDDFCCSSFFSALSFALGSSVYTTGTTEGWRGWEVKGTGVNEQGARRVILGRRGG